MVKDLQEHPRVCGQEVKQARGSRAVACFEDEDVVLRALRDVRRQLRSGNYTGPVWRMPQKSTFIAAVQEIKPLGTLAEEIFQQ